MTTPFVFPILRDFRIERREHIQGWVCKWLTDVVSRDSTYSRVLWAEAPNERPRFRGREEDRLGHPVLVIAVGNLGRGPVFLVFEPGPHGFQGIPWSGDDGYFQFCAWQIANQKLAPYN